MSPRSLVGLAGAACVACCAGPVLAAIGGIAALGALGTPAFGGVALVTAAVAITAVLGLRQRSRRRTHAEPQRIELGPTRRPRAPIEGRTA